MPCSTFICYQPDALEPPPSVTVTHTGLVHVSPPGNVPQAVRELVLRVAEALTRPRRSVQDVPRVWTAPGTAVQLRPSGPWSMAG